MGIIQSKKSDNSSKEPLVLDSEKPTSRSEKIYTFADRNREEPSDLEDWPLEDEEKIGLKSAMCKQNLTKNK